MSTTHLNPSHDSYTDENAPTTAQSQTSSTAKLSVGYNGRSGGGETQTWNKFDLSTLAGATINSAIWRQRVYFPQAGDYGSQEIGAYRSTDTSWDEATITWNNAPAVGATLYSSNYMDGTPNWDWDFDVTTAVQAALASGAISLVLKPVNTGAFSDFYQWLMQDTDYTVGPPTFPRPRLIIDYTAASTFRPQVMMIM